ncbi:MAG TPA: riboflavin synthase, partial [Actinomycetota bacterium]|nr:riboflavin synthase [Actinomycetota bacterium]
LGVGDEVNLERPVRAGAELGGHVVQGHVDGVGRVGSVREASGGREVAFEVPPSLGRYLVEKGSVTVDGVSLTVTRAELSSFEVALVPHTLRATTLGRLEEGSRVNVEVDVLAKYVEKLVQPYAEAALQADDAGYL